LKLGRSVLEVIAGARVIPVVEKPVNRIHFDSDIDCVGLEALRT